MAKKEWECVGLGLLLEVSPNGNNESNKSYVFVSKLYLKSFQINLTRY